MPREKSRYRDKRSTSHSSESSYDRKKYKSKHKRRSRSRDKSESSRTSKRRRSPSRSRYRRRSYSRSVSRDRYESKSQRRSSRSKSKRSKHSRDRSRSLSSSHSRTKHSKREHKKHRRRSRSSSHSDTYEIDNKSLKSKCFINADDTETQVEKAIKAAEAAGVTLTKIPTYEYKEVEIREDMPTIHDRNVLDDINSDSFVQKTFTSSKTKKESSNIVIDLNAETVKVPQSEAKPQNDDSIINFANIPCEEELKEMWVKKLFHFRKKMLKGEIQ